MLKKIARSVLIVHLILIALLLGGSPLPSPKRKSLVVKTVTLSPKPQTQKLPTPPSAQPVRSTPPKAPSPSKPPSPLNTAKKKPAAPPQKAPSPKPAAPKPAAPKPIPTPKTSSPPKKNPPAPPPVVKSAPSPSSSKLAELSKALQESLQQMESPPSSKPIAKTPLTAPPTLKIDHLEENSSTDYAQKITHYLHESLHLPDFGEVKIQLTLHQDGRIVKLAVLEAENERNKKYLEETLPHLRLPPFTGTQKERTLTFTFCNEF